MIWYAGKCSEDVSVRVEYYPGRTWPAKKQDSSDVPGRNGALLDVQGNFFANYTQSYDIYISAEAPGLAQVLPKVADWLLGPVGYQRLEDDYFPAIYRLAAFEGPIDIANTLGHFGRASIKFNCQPQSWLKTGENPITLTEPGSLANPTAFTALPLITVTGTGAGVLTVGSIEVEINSNPGQIILDSSLMDATDPQGDNLNAVINAPIFPQLGAGLTPVSFSGAISCVQIIPRWWTV